MRRRPVSNLLALAILGLLLERPMHPYEIATTLRERHKDSSFKITTGSLYDTIAALARNEWIAEQHTSRAGNRPERTVYAHTELGQREFVRWLDELIRAPTPEYPKFIAAVSYLGALGRDRARAALAERAERLAAQIERYERVLADTVGAGRTPRLFMIEVECAAHAARSELDWTRQTIVDIDDGTLFWPVVERTPDGFTWTAPTDTPPATPTGRGRS